MLLTYDGYSEYMSMGVLELFRRNRIVVYAIPTHTCGKTQPLDVVALRSYKRENDDAIQRTLRSDEFVKLDMCHYCSVLKHAYHAAFTRANIQASFSRSDMWSLDSSRLLSTLRSRDSNALDEINQPEQLLEMLERKRKRT